MKQLWDQINQLQIEVVNEEIASFAQCKEPFVINCTGEASRVLNNDLAVIPTRGHFFMLKADPATQLDYMLFTAVTQGEAKEKISFFPKPAYVTAQGEIDCSGVLGSTFIPCEHLKEVDVALEELDSKEFSKLVERARLFFYGK